MMKKANEMSVNAYLWAQKFGRDERGDFGIGQLAAAVAAVVIIGVMTMTITGLLPDWIGQIWSQITLWFERITTT